MRLDAVTFRQLRAILAVAETGSLTSAATKLSLTTPAVHSQIKGLETALGCTLLVRTADYTRSRLTAEGEAVLRAATLAEASLSQCGHQISAISRGMTGRVALGVVSTAKYFAPWLVKKLRHSCPEIEIALRVGNRESTIAGLASGSLDLAIMGRPPREPMVSADPIGIHPHGILANRHHPLADGRNATPEELFAETFLSREEGSGTRIVMNRYLDWLGDGRVFDYMEMDSNETIKQAAMAGLGIAFLSLHTVTEELAARRLVLVQAPGLPINRHWFLVQPHEPASTPAVLHIRKQILAYQGAFLPELNLTAIEP